MELSARTTLAGSLLAQGKPVEAGKEIRTAEATAATTEDRLLAIAFTTTAARIHAANARVAEASRSLGKALAEATKLGCGRCQLEARLATAQIEMKQGKSAAARERLEALEQDATAKGFLLIARKASTAGSK